MTTLVPEKLKLPNVMFSLLLFVPLVESNLTLLKLVNKNGSLTFFEQAIVNKSNNFEIKAQLQNRNRATLCIEENQCFKSKDLLRSSA